MFTLYMYHPDGSLDWEGSFVSIKAAARCCRELCSRGCSSALLYIKEDDKPSLHLCYRDYLIYEAQASRNVERRTWVKKLLGVK